jgi:hypothetical protein
MQEVGLGYNQLHMDPGHEAPPPADIESYAGPDGADMLRIGTAHAKKRISKNFEKVPAPLFHENALQTELLAEMLRTYSSGVTSMLLIGNQGVGKNKLVDRLLQLLNAEREYVQLHRDTTVQSLTTIPNLVGGKIYYDDSPLVRAAREGTVLVIDEADKAPVEVVCLLKMLVEDGELLLQDGRRLLSKERRAALLPSLADSDIVEIHKDFRLIALANRPGFPFHGNNFFRECGDVLTTHVIDNLDVASEIELLRAYGPDVPLETLSRLALAFQDLRAAHASGRLSYPFSAREAVAVVKHAQAFPQDGIAAAVEDFLGFEGATPKTRRVLAEVFRSRGIPVPLEPPGGGGGGSNPLLASVQLAVSEPVASPGVSALPAAAFQPCPAAWEVRLHKTSSKAWNITETATSAYTVDSARLTVFSEQLGQLLIGGEEGGVKGGGFSGVVLDACADCSGTLHVLSDRPLTLHSFYEIGRGVATGGDMERKYVKRTLISEEGAWRMGSVQALLLPDKAVGEGESGRGGGGVVVVLPELSVALTVGEDAAADVVSTTLPKGLAAAAAGKGRKGGRQQSRGFMDRLFSDSDGGAGGGGGAGAFRLTSSTGPAQGGRHAVLWREGGAEAMLYDVERDVVLSVQMGSNAGISSLHFLRRNSDKSEEFMVVCDASTFVLKVAGRLSEEGGSYSGAITVSEMGAAEAASFRGEAAPLLEGGGGGGRFGAATGVTTYGGTSAAYAGQLCPEAGQLRVWGRDGAGAGAARVAHSAVSDTAAYNALIGDSKRKKGIECLNCLL